MGQDIIQDFVDELIKTCQDPKNKTQCELHEQSKLLDLTDNPCYTINSIVSHLTGTTTTLVWSGNSWIAGRSRIKSIQWAIMFHRLAKYIERHPELVPPSLYTSFMAHFIHLSPSHPQITLENGGSLPCITDNMTRTVLSILKLPYGIGQVENGGNILIQPTQSLQELIR